MFAPRLAFLFLSLISDSPKREISERSKKWQNLGNINTNNYSISNIYQLYKCLVQTNDQTNVYMS